MSNVVPLRGNGGSGDYLVLLLHCDVTLGELMDALRAAGGEIRVSNDRVTNALVIHRAASRSAPKVQS